MADDLSTPLATRGEAYPCWRCGTRKPASAFLSLSPFCRTCAPDDAAVRRLWTLHVVGAAGAPALCGAAGREVGGEDS